MVELAAPPVAAELELGAVAAEPVPPAGAEELELGVAATEPVRVNAPESSGEEDAACPELDVGACKLPVED